MQQLLTQTPQRAHSRILRQRSHIRAGVILRHADEDLDVLIPQGVFLRLQELPQLELAHPRFREGDVLATHEAATGRFVDGPGEVRGGEDEDAGGVACGVVAAACGGFLQVRPLDQELGFDAAGGLVFGGAAAGAEEGVDFVDEDDAGREGFCEGEEGADEFFAFAQIFGGQAAGADGEEDAFGFRGHGAGEHRFAGSGGAEEEHSSCGLAEAHEEVWAEEGVDDCFFEGGFGRFEA